MLGKSQARKAHNTSTSIYSLYQTETEGRKDGWMEVVDVSCIIASHACTILSIYLFHMYCIVWKKVHMRHTTRNTQLLQVKRERIASCKYCTVSRSLAWVSVNTSTCSSNHLINLSSITYYFPFPYNIKSLPSLFWY